MCACLRMKKVPAISTWGRQFTTEEGRIQPIVVFELLKLISFNQVQIDTE